MLGASIISLQDSRAFFEEDQQEKDYEHENPRYLVHVLLAFVFEIAAHSLSSVGENYRKYFFHAVRIWRHTLGSSRCLSELRFYWERR